MTFVARIPWGAWQSLCMCVCVHVCVCACVCILEGREEGKNHQMNALRSLFTSRRPLAIGSPSSHFIAEKKANKTKLVFRGSQPSDITPAPKSLLQKPHAILAVHPKGHIVSPVPPVSPLFLLDQVDLDPPA